MIREANAVYTGSGIWLFANPDHRGGMTKTEIYGMHFKEVLK